MHTVDKKNKLNLLWPKMACWDPIFDPKIPLKRVYVGPLFVLFPGNEAHNFFLGPEMGSWVGGKFMLKKLMSFVSPLNLSSDFKPREIIFKFLGHLEKPRKMPCKTRVKLRFSGLFLKCNLLIRPRNPRTTPTKLTINIASTKLGVVFHIFVFS